MIAALRQSQGRAKPDSDKYTRIEACVTQLQGSAATLDMINTAEDVLKINRHAIVDVFLKVVWSCALLSKSPHRQKRINKETNGFFRAKELLQECRREVSPDSTPR